MKVTQNCFDLFKCLNKTGMQISKLSFVLDKFINRVKGFLNCRSKIVM